MKGRCHDQLVMHCGGDVHTRAFDYISSMKAKTIADFETGFIAPIYGYEDNVDYYRMTSCGYFLTGIAVPTYVINSQDDPFIDPACFPLESTYMGGGNAPVLMKQLDHGGHSAYMFHQRGRRSGEGGNDDDGCDVNYDDDDGISSWMPTELARFVNHVHDHPLSGGGTTIISIDEQ